MDEFTSFLNLIKRSEAEEQGKFATDFAENMAKIDNAFSSTKQKLDDIDAALNGATATDIASTLVMRDTNKRAKFADPAENQDAATKKYVDDSVSGKANKVSTPTENNFAGLTSDGDLKDSGKKATDFVEKNFKTATITTTWSGTEAPYIQEITISGIRDDHKPIIGPIYDDDVETAIAQQEAWSLIDKIVTDINKIICYCFTDKPEVAIDIQLWVV